MARKISTGLRGRPREELTTGPGRFVPVRESWKKMSEEDRNKFRSAWPELAAVIEGRRR